MKITDLSDEYNKYFIPKKLKFQFPAQSCKLQKLKYRDYGESVAITLSKGSPQQMQLEFPGLNLCIGHPSKKENLAASSRFKPTINPPIMVDPEREQPGIRAKACVRPIN